MEKNSLWVIIFEAICGLVCVGLGIYYAVGDKSTQAVVFIVVGAVSIVMAMRTFLNMRKAKKSEEEKNKEDIKKQ